VRRALTLFHGTRTKAKRARCNSQLSPFAMIEDGSEMPSLCYLQPSLRYSGLTDPLPGRHRKCESDHSPGSAVSLEAQRLALPERAMA
jgi:hypothetical protein